jgi:O-antigen/teichoic acid export membrane protein
MSSYYSDGNVAGIRVLSGKAERYLSMVLFPAVALIFVLSEPICRVVLGDQFVLSAPILIILTAVALIHGTTQPYTQQLGAANRISLAARISGVVFCVNVVLNFVFIPAEFLGLRVLGLGAVGAAFATLISICVGSFLFRFYAYKITKSKTNTRILIHFVAALVMMLVVRFGAGKMSATSWYTLMLFAIAGVAIYFGVLVVLREFNRSDMDLFLKVINPVQLINYARREVKSGYVTGKS